ncbi:hypothetical protein J0910_17405 [Nocardiopsis sp. CNT-189]|uniref:hypothetical protein n=1 Tax=Nocardiopsis oceanisediminis TaxID=2816862 RepID=UPI003B38F6D8
MRNRIFIAPVLFGISAACVLLALYAPVIWFISLALLAGAVSSAWQGGRALLAGSAGASAEPAQGPPPASPGASAPDASPPGTAAEPPEQAERTEQEKLAAGEELVDAVFDSAAGTFRIMKATAIVAAVVFFGLLILFVLFVGALLFYEGRYWAGLFTLGPAGWLVWYVCGPLLGVWNPQSIFSGGDGGDGGGE